MFSRFKAFISKNYFDKELPFDYRIFSIFFFLALGVSLLSATTNTILGKGYFGVVFQWVFNVFFIVMLVLPVKTRMAASKPLLLICMFVYIPMLSFFTAGYDGTAGMIAVLGMFLIVILYRGRGRLLLVLGNILLWLIVCTVQYLYPHLVVPHGAEQAKYMDYMVALALTFGGVALLGTYFRNAYELEQERIKRLVDRDPLTAIYNRRFLMGYLEDKIETSGKKGESLAVFMLDLDDFKRINDDFGHSFGDTVLTTFADIVQGCLRKTDVLARYGGEEFIIALDTIDIDDGKRIAEKIRSAVEKVDFGNHVHITISIGLAKARPGESVDDLIVRVDSYLYKAKKNGKNQVFAGE